MEAKPIITHYFKPLLLILLAVAVMLVCILIGVFLSSNRTVMLILTGLFLLAACVFNLPMIVYYFQVRIEWRKKDVCSKTIIIRSIERSRFHNYYYRGGILVDEGKSVLVDKDGKKYHFIGGNPMESKHLLTAALHISCLRKTGFLLSVGLVSESPSQELFDSFTRCFSYYIPEAERRQIRKNNKKYNKHR